MVVTNKQIGEIPNNLPVVQRRLLRQYLNKVIECGVELGCRIDTNPDDNILRWSATYGVVPVTVEFIYYVNSGMVSPSMWVEACRPSRWLMFDVDCTDMLDPASTYIHCHIATGWGS